MIKNVLLCFLLSSCIFLPPKVGDCFTTQYDHYKVYKKYRYGYKVIDSSGFVKYSLLSDWMDFDRVDCEAYDWHE